MEPRYATRAQAKQANAAPTITVRERRVTEDQDRYVASLEASIDAVRDWAEKYAPLITDEQAVRELDDIVGSSAELHLARRERVVRTEARRESLRAAAQILSQIADGADEPFHAAPPREVDGLRP